MNTIIEINGEITNNAGIYVYRDRKKEDVHRRKG
jgi:hypothetical protein